MAHYIRCAHCKRTHPTAQQVKDCAFRMARGAMHQQRVQQVANTRTALPIENPWPLKTPRAMVEAMRDGRYAAAEQGYRGDDFDHYTFIRVSRPTTGKRKGCLVLQTQHSEAYSPFLTIYPSGKAYFYKNSNRLDMALLMIAADPFTTAMNYGRLIGRCSRCGKTLTDERSRYYGIGPECEKHWPEIINYVNETKGVFVP